ncbi:MAG TPA: SCO family protein [Hellea balneolensis]|uniref:SCO family protein n=1 Tax=Hellea balneolensis TaxID=287478 RepID=A0A7C5LRN4_9PROT|nr:SCO family protein [Hellea balneolensis]
MRHKSIPVFFMAALFMAGLGSGCQNPEQTNAPKAVVSHGKAAIGGPFTLIDQTGKTVTQNDFKGKAQLVYFGFALCPDVCPTALQQMGAALRLAGKSADDYQPIFITVDPLRDTPEKLAKYVKARGFPEHLVALSGSPDQINAVIKAFGVYAKKVEDDSSEAGYTYDHSSMIYLMDKNGEFVEVFSHNDSPDKIAKRLVAFAKTGQ